jgi:lantibiotic biosynthesis protein
VLTVEGLTARVLADAGPPDANRRREPDWGLPLLAMLYGTRRRRRRPTARAAVIEWARGYARQHNGPGVFVGGLAGNALGLAYAAVVEPKLGGVARLAAERVADWCATADLRDRDVGFADYDLLLGPSGVLLAITSQPSTPPTRWQPLTRHLINLSDVDDLTGLRIGDGDETDAWSVGRVNLGLGHGVPGVLAALIAAERRAGPRPDARITASIGRIAAFLVRHGRRGDRGVICWPFATPGPSTGPTAERPDTGEPSAAMQWHRQAWCYGTPGIAWQLAEAGEVLGDAALREFGISAMASLCDAWDDGHLDTNGVSNRLAICHGAAGLLAIADAFALHTGLEPAKRLAEHLDGVLLAELDRIAELAETSLSLLVGATGILAVLLSREPHRRGWLHTLGLR